MENERKNLKIERVGRSFIQELIEN